MKKRAVALILSIVLLINSSLIFAQSGDIAVGENETEGLVWEEGIETPTVPIPDEEEEVFLTLITVSLPNKTEYFVGENLDTTGMTVIAHYSDNSFEEVTSRAVVDIMTFESVGKITVTVTYEEKTASFEVDVINAPLFENELPRVDWSDSNAEDKNYSVVWENWNGTVLETDTVSYGTVPEYNGIIPTKDGNAQYSYTFNGWSPAISAVTSDMTYIATFTATLNKYTVTWRNYDGTILETDTVNYGTVPEYNGKTPVRATDSEFTYTFIGWSPTISAVIGDITYTAEYESEEIKMPESEMKLTLSGEKKCSGSQVVVPVAISENSGIMGIQFIVNYEEGLTFENVQLSADIPFTLTKKTEEQSVRLLLDSEEFYYDDGTVLNLTFSIDTDASAGEYGVNLSQIIVTDTNFEDVELPDAYTTVQVLKGDVNGDGRVTVTDVVLLRQYILGNHRDKVVEAVVDINHNGSVTVTDVVLLRQYILGNKEIY